MQGPKAIDCLNQYTPNLVLLEQLLVIFVL